MNTTVNKTTGSNPMSELFAKVMDKFDTDKDKKLNAAEFGAFLSGLIGDNKSTLAGQTASTGTSLKGDPGSEKMDGNGPFRFYLAGFDHNNLDNAAMQTVKYRAARIFVDFKPMPENIPAVVDRLQQIGINAKQVSSDKVDFGDGWGPIDIIQGAYPGGGVAWQWLRPEATT